MYIAANNMQKLDGRKRWTRQHQMPPDDVEKPPFSCDVACTRIMCQGRVCYGDLLVKFCTMSAIAIVDS